MSVPPAELDNVEQTSIFNAIFMGRKMKNKFFFRNLAENFAKEVISNS